MSESIDTDLATLRRWAIHFTDPELVDRVETKLAQLRKERDDWEIEARFQMRMRDKAERKLVDDDYEPGGMDDALFRHSRISKVW